MAKIPFDIKYRPQIENGEYKVVYVENSSTEQYPVEILKWDSNSDAGCIIGCIRLNGKDRVYVFGENGEHKVSGGDNRLFIITPEEELTEFEKCVKHLMEETIEANDTHDFKADAAMLLRMAKQQLLESGECLTREWHEIELMVACKKEYYKGKTEVLNDLPRWKKAVQSFGNYTVAPTETGEYCLLIDGYFIMLSDLEKLPGFKEDEK